MGGNTTVKTRDGIETEPQEVPLDKVGRKEFKVALQVAFKVLNKLFLKEHKKRLWVDEKKLIDGAMIFNGSTSFIMGDIESDEDIVKYKPNVGDCDVMIPREYATDLYDTLEKIEKKEFAKGVTHMGVNANTRDKLGNTLIAVFLVELGNTKYPVQIDFELSEFIDNEPTEWASFSHGSSFSDAKAGVKAVHHKYLLRGLFGAISAREDIILFTPAATIEKPRFKDLKGDMVRLTQFSVEKGVGKGYEQVLTPEGKEFMHDGKYVYREKKKVGRSYETRLDNIFKLAFGQETSKDIELIHSFVGILKLGKKYLDKSQKQRTLDRYLDILYGARGNQVQTIDKNDVNKDLQLKGAAYDMIIKEWGLKQHSDYNGIVDAYVLKAFGKKINESVRLKSFSDFL